MKASASFSTFCISTSSGLPPSKTTCAAPASVPGAIAATSADSSRKNPAEPARDPDGATNTMTGTRERKIAPTMVRIESSKPPGVSISMSNACAPSELARSSARVTSSALTG